MRVNWYDPTDFNVTFGNITRKAKSIFTDLSEAIKTAASAATSVSFHQSYWSAAAKNTDNIGKMLENGLLSAGNYLSSGDDSEMLIDSRGIFVNTTSGQYANKDSIFIGGGRILFTEDHWKSVSMAVGRADVNGESKFGVFADFLIAGYVAGSTIEGSVIKGGAIIGTDFNNGNGTFHVDSKGNLTASSVDVTGKITGTSGSIGDFTIDHAIYNGKSSLTSTQNGVYIGKDGISLGANSVFKITDNGVVTASAGTIGGAAISNNSIHASNGNWYINSDGSSSFKNITITGNASYGSDIYHPFSGTAVTHINDLVVGTVTADYVHSKAIDAGFITADTISAIYATIGSLDAVNARFNSLNANDITTGTLSANRIDVEGLFSADKIGSLVIEVNTLVAAIRVSADRLINAPEMRCDDFTCNSSFNGHNISWGTITVGGNTYTVLMG